MLNEYFERIEKGPFAIIMTGMPASGKTTIVNEMREGHSPETCPKILSTDDYIELLARESGTTYDQLWSTFIDDARKCMMAEFQETVAVRKSFIVDRTNVTQKSRRRFLAQLPKDYFKISLMVNVTRDVQAERLVQREGKFIQPDDIENLWERLEIPSIEEGFDVVASV